MPRKKLGIVIFDEVEVLDFCGPFEVFSVARINEERRREESSPFEQFLISQSGEPAVIYRLRQNHGRGSRALRALDPALWQAGMEHRLDGGRR